MEDLPVYTRDDYLTTTKPFEYLYAHKENKFEMKQLLGRHVHTSAGGRNQELGRPIQRLHRDSQRDLSARFNRTDFTGQEMELDCGSWTALTQVFTEPTSSALR